ncbi:MULTISPECIES: hypothetical protein [Streptomyces]|uniref:Uncharacterized protein n=1 Tax=Streptomyces badius TaxID=1941 RepID=A0ABQ2TI15_STRBA|nr:MULTISPECIES: hypothetical protein [Streptomyces]GGS71294.1 hypothetical protein GCM10010253_52920 [Streptomyces badius]
MRLVTEILKSSLLAATLLGLAGPTIDASNRSTQADTRANSASCGHACPNNAPGADLGWG